MTEKNISIFHKTEYLNKISNMISNTEHNFSRKKKEKKKK